MLAERRSVFDRPAETNQPGLPDDLVLHVLGKEAPAPYRERGISADAGLEWSARGVHLAEAATAH